MLARDLGTRVDAQSINLTVRSFPELKKAKVSVESRRYLLGQGNRNLHRGERSSGTAEKALIRLRRRTPFSVHIICKVPIARGLGESYHRTLQVRAGV